MPLQKGGVTSHQAKATQVSFEIETEKQQITMSTSESTTSQKRVHFDKSIDREEETRRANIASANRKYRKQREKLTQKYQEQCKKATFEIVKRQELNHLLHQLCSQNDFAYFRTVHLVKNGRFPVNYAWEAFEHDHAMFQGAQVDYNSLKPIQTDAINNLVNNPAFKEKFHAQLPTAVPSNDSGSNSFKQDNGHSENQRLYEIADVQAQWARENPGQHFPMENENDHIIQGSFSDTDISRLTDVNSSSSITSSKNG